MLFFLLPFYWKSTSFDAANCWFVVLLAVCAILSTLDIVFDRVLMKWRALASAFHGIILFGCLNLVIPALFPDTRTMVSLLAAAGITVVAFFTLHFPLGMFKSKWHLIALGVSVPAGIGLVYLGRSAIPPVPMYIAQASVGPPMAAFVENPSDTDEWTVAMEAKTIHAGVIKRLIAVTDVVVPGGKGDRLHHVWRHDGVEVARTNEARSRIYDPRPGVIRMGSSLGDPPQELVGKWSVDVETEDGQLVGRTEFDVVE
jgi:hypothetical protein